jgi:hypothetical protein
MAGLVAGSVDLQLQQLLNSLNSRVCVSLDIVYTLFSYHTILSTFAVMMTIIVIDITLIESKKDTSNPSSIPYE